MQKYLMTFIKTLVLVGIVLPSTACSIDAIKRIGYWTGTHYVCNYQEPNLSDKVWECEKNTMSYEEYEAARAETLSSN